MSIRPSARLLGEQVDARGGERRHQNLRDVVHGVDLLELLEDVVLGVEWVEEGA